MKPRPIPGLSVIVGPPGSGKTLTATYYALLYDALGWKTWGNYGVRIPGWNRITELKHLDEAYDGLLVLDEAWTIADSRHFTKKRNVLVGAALLTARKHNLDVILVTQDFSMIDVRLRQNTARIIVPILEGSPPSKLAIQVCIPTIVSPEMPLAWNPIGNLLQIRDEPLSAVMSAYSTREVVTPLASMIDADEAKAKEEKQKAKEEERKRKAEEKAARPKNPPGRPRTREYPTNPVLPSREFATSTDRRFIAVKCPWPKCGHEWVYRGRSYNHITCPRCYGHARLDKNGLKNAGAPPVEATVPP